MTANDRGAGTLVVVVTDDAQLNEAATYAFPADVEVVTVPDARAALDLMQDRTPDVAVVDLQAGSAGGFSLAREMSQTERLAQIPILMLLDRPDDRWVAEQGGARLVRVKPVESGELARLALGLTAPR